MNGLTLPITETINIIVYIIAVLIILTNHAQPQGDPKHADIHPGLTLLLLIANLVKMKWWQKAEKWLRNGKNICPLFGNIRNGNTQKEKIWENCYTLKISHSTVFNAVYRMYCMMQSYQFLEYLIFVLEHISGSGPDDFKFMLTIIPVRTMAINLFHITFAKMINNLFRDWN